MGGNSDLRIAVIGAGPAGIAAGHALLERGFDNFTLFEKSDAAGGTWHLHSYPGLACDLWAHSYTYSYRPNAEWSANFVDQPEIEAYLQQCTREFGLEPHLALHTCITAARYKTNGTWALTTADNATHTFDVVINAMGGQHTPIFPAVDGIDSFTGEHWHSTHWNHKVSLQDKRVVLVGSAAAAVQIVPQVAKRARHLTVLQRTPNWIMPRNHKVYSRTLKALFRHVPPILSLWQRGQALMMSVVLDGVTLNHKRMEQFEARVHKFIEKSIKDPAVRSAVTPRSRYGCKRGLVSDEYYPTLNRANVELIAEGLQSVKPKGVVTASDREIEADVIIYCTGYQVLDFERIDVTGKDGKKLADEMAKAPIAYKGIAASGFPNYFFTAGPNGLAINASYFKNVECNVNTIVRLLQDKQSAGIDSIVVRPDVNDSYNASLSHRYETYSWGASNCNSYYRTETGHAPFLFPGGYKEYHALHAACSIEDFQPA
ncbi:MAG: NAD(P)/FAD-dependent oxidoreductase [Halioglobus sp.]|nr:NAD(P)/FAD-dependent oxidoreductase [Halioglobus sp.]